MNKKTLHRWITKFEVPIVAICFFLCGFLVHDIAARFDSDFGLLIQAHGFLENNYLYPLPDHQTLQRGMVEGMLLPLDDPYTVFVNPEQHAVQVDTFAGRYGGIGAQLLFNNSGEPVIYPFPDGPAAQAGIKNGDTIVSIDGETIPRGIRMDTLISLLRGEVGSSLDLVVLRTTSADVLLEFRVMRMDIQTPTVQSYTLPDQPSIGVIDINLIGAQTPQETDQALKTLMESGVESIILDLRGNGGGLLDESIAVADYFLASGVIVIERNRDYTELVYGAEPGDFGESISIAVLVDGGSASGAEIIAAALQENHRGLIIGSTSFGKGSVQSIYELMDGSSIHITTAQWLTPSGTTIDITGVSPDILIQLEDENEDSAIEAAVQLLRKE